MSEGADGDWTPASDNRTARAAFVSALILPGDVGAEIGVNLGVFAYHVLLPRRPSQLYLIDPWEYGLQADMEIERTPENQAARDLDFERVRRLFARYAEVEVIRAKAEYAAAGFADESLDYVYIDGEHSYAAMTRDLTNYYPKVRRGGHLIGDDYGWSGVGAAVDAFFALHEHDLLFLFDPYTEQAAGQFALKKVGAGSG